MKKFFTALVLLSVFSRLSAQNISDLETFESAIKPGTVLTYDVNAGGKTYQWIITIKQLGDAISFDWKMTDPVNQSGTVHMSAAAVAQATALMHAFKAGETNLTNETSVWISRKIFQDEGANAVAEIKVNGAADTSTVMSNTISEFNFNVNGNLVAVPGWELEGGSVIKYTIDVLESQRYPIIYRIDAGWTMLLSKVETP